MDEALHWADEEKKHDAPGTEYMCIDDFPL